MEKIFFGGYDQNDLLPFVAREHQDFLTAIIISRHLEIVNIPLFSQPPLICSVSTRGLETERCFVFVLVIDWSRGASEYTEAHLRMQNRHISNF